MKKIIFIWLLTVVNMNNIKANSNNYTDEFINENYKYALISTVGTNIPISVVLAQCILESGWGKSGLAKEGNNYFGITATKGNKKYKNTQYRTFQNKIESFIHHAKIISTNDAYKPLKTLSNTDYIAWSNGLQRCGYAESNVYAKTLIRIIDKYKLNKYDLMNKEIEKKEIKSFGDLSVGDTIYGIKYDGKFKTTVKALSRNDKSKKFDFILFDNDMSFINIKYESVDFSITDCRYLSFFVKESDRDKSYKEFMNYRKDDYLKRYLSMINSLLVVGFDKNEIINEAIKHLNKYEYENKIKK